MADASILCSSRHGQTGPSPPAEFHHDGDANIPSLVGLYAKLSRMRVVSSKPVLHSAEHITQKILDTYLEPDKSFVEVREMARKGGIDLLREFANACRDEFEDLQARQF